MSFARSHRRILTSTVLAAMVAVAGIPTVSATALQAPAAGASITQNAPATPTALATGSGRVFISATAFIARGERAKVTVTPSREHVGKRAAVQAETNGRWRTLNVSRITSARPKHYTLTTSRTVRLRVVVLNSGGRAVAVSQPCMVIVHTAFGR